MDPSRRCSPVEGVASAHGWCRGIAIARPAAPADGKQSRGSCHDATTSVIEMSPKRSQAKRRSLHGSDRQLGPPPAHERSRAGRGGRAVGSRLMRPRWRRGPSRWRPVARRPPPASLLCLADQAPATVESALMQLVQTGRDFRDGRRCSSACDCGGGRAGCIRDLRAREKDMVDRESRCSSDGAAASASACRCPI